VPAAPEDGDIFREVFGDDGHWRRESFEGQKSIAGIREAQSLQSGGVQAVKRTMNPRVVSRCNSAGRIDEEQTGEVA